MMLLKKRKRYFIGVLAVLFCIACNKNTSRPPAPPPPAESFYFNKASINNVVSNNFSGTDIKPQVKLSFTAPVGKSSATAAILFKDANANLISTNLSYQNGDSTIVVTPAGPLQYLSKYTITVSPELVSAKNTKLGSSVQVNLMTAIDSSDKFPVLSDSALLDLVEQQTFQYFWDFGHPVSGLARERNTSGDIVTTGGSGFGVMAILVGINRHFITRSNGLSRITKIVNFLTNNVQKYHGAFPHWLNGATGATIPFSANDDGADLVETAYMMQGLLSARQFFNSADAGETELRDQINNLWNGVEWDWFRKNGEDALYWHWSPDKGWIMNMPVKGWNEALITYVLAASSATHSISQAVYTNGWAQNGSFKNGNTFYNYILPLGPPLGGPLFFEQYSFLGLNPYGLSDQYADYQQQVTNHTLINYNYCKANPRKYYGYSDVCWGLTASDDPAGYAVHDPQNDNGVITPSAALSSFPYSPQESLQAVKFFYYKLGDKLWGQYGFTDAFSLSVPWFASSYLAIDQGPIIVMIENYRTGLLWNLFTSCPEIKAGLLKLGFQAPYL